MFSAKAKFLRGGDAELLDGRLDLAEHKVVRCLVRDACLDGFEQADGRGVVVQATASLKVQADERKCIARAPITGERTRSTASTILGAGTTSSSKSSRSPCRSE
jgi:hypothetical protein